MSPAAVERMRRQRHQDSARKREVAAARATKRLEVARWRQEKSEREAGAGQAKVKAGMVTPPPGRSAREMRERGQNAVKLFLERQAVLKGKQLILETERLAKWDPVRPSPRAALVTSKANHCLGVGVG